MVSILIAASSCGGGGGGAGDPPVTVSTLAYVVTECRGDAEALTIRQSLQIRQGEQTPITVVEHSAHVAGAGFYCGAVGVVRQGPNFAELGVFRRLGVSPDGSQVVFEVTDEPTDYVIYPLVFPPNALPAVDTGIFAVRADGTGLHRLGPASRVGSYFLSLFVFSPNGRTIAYTDRGPGPNNRDAVQIFTLDLLTSDRRQVTQLPPARGLFGGTYQPFFNDNETITFSTHANVEGNNTDGKNIVVTVKTTDPTRHMTVAAPVVALPGSEVLTSFRITGSQLDAAVLTLPGTPVNPRIGNSGGDNIQEVFDIDRENNVLQLTNFRRVDTYTPMVSADGQRVLFSASADPLGTNPTENCQLFSIDRNGGDLRQLTDFHEVPEGQQSRAGCSHYQRPLGCTAFYTNRDIRSGAVVFYSSCDPFGTNPYGTQVFAMRSDGTGLRQLTNTRGYTPEASGTVTVEEPFPFAWPGLQLRNQL